MHDEDLMQQQLDILNMMYKTVRQVAKNMIYCLDYDSNVKIVNIHGDVIMEGTTKEIRLFDSFMCKVDFDEITIYSILRDISKTFKSTGRIFNSIEPVGSHFIRIGEDIYNTYFENITDYKKNGITLGSRVTTPLYNIVRVNYYAHTYSGRMLYILLNESTEKVMSWDTIDIGGGFGLVGVVFTPNQGTSVTTETVRDLKYKLTFEGEVISEKSYDDILKIREDKENKYLTTVLAVNGHAKRGVIQSDGKEILPAMYDAVVYLAHGTFLLEDNTSGIRKYALYSTNLGIIYNFGDIVNCYQSGLPIYMFTLATGETTIYSCIDASIFNITEFAKHFNCAYCKDDPTILRVELPYGTQYVTNRLSSITNIHTIAKLNTMEWVPM